MDTNQKCRDSRMRRLADRNGYRLVKSRKRTENYYDQGQYMILDAQSNFCVFGDKCDLTLDEVEAWLQV